MRTSLIAPLVLAMMVLTGCLQQGDDPDRPADGTGEWAASDQYGVALEAVDLHERITSGSAKTWKIQAVNGGPPEQNLVTYNAACAGPFSVALVTPDGTEAHTDEPTLECSEHDGRELMGRERLDHEWTWDGRIWTGSDGKVVPPEGVYTLRFTFEGHHEGNSEHATDDLWGETQVQVRSS